MIVLGIETATTAVGAALYDESGPLASSTARAERSQVETLPVMIEELARRSGVALSELSAVAVDVGPGRFTGLRVGIATAKALSFGLVCPAIACRSTAVLAAAFAPCSASVVPVIDMRRGEIAYELGDGSGPYLGSVDDLLTALQSVSGDVLLIGDGALRYREEITAGARGFVPGFASAGHGAPDPAVLAEFGYRALLEGRTIDPMALEPEYLREPDVRISWVTRETDPSGKAQLVVSGESN